MIQRGSTDIVITHNGTNIDLGGNNITLTATNPRLELIYQGGAWRSIGGAGSTIIPTTLNGVAGVSDTLQNRYSNRRFVEAQDYGLVLGSSAAASTNSSIINGLIAAIGSRGGGILVLPPGDIYIAATIDIKFPRVQLWGAGFESFHDSGTSTSTDPIFGTRLIATTATTMVKIRTPYASEQGVSASATWKYTGAGFKYIILQGGAIATAAMIIDSVSGIDVDVYATNFNASTFFTVTSGVSGTDLGEACDVQVSRMSFRARAIDTAADQAAHILTLSGSSNANCSLNRNPLYGIDVYAEHKNGNILNGQNCDNNDISIVGVRVSGGTGYTALFNGTTASQTQGGSSNRLVYVAGGGPIYNQGVGDTNSHGTVTAGIWNEAYYDDGNGTPLPTAGTGSKWTARQTSNGHFNEIISNNGVYGYFVTSITSNSRIYDGGPSKIAFALASAGSDTAYLDFQTIAGVPYLDGAAGFIGLAVSGTPVLRCDTNGFGYQTGQSLGGTVTQATSKSTGVTLNKPNGQITMNAATLNAYSAAQFTLTNSCIGASDVVILNHISGGSPGAYVFTSTPAVGSTLITVRNVLNVNLSEAIVIQYSIIKSTVN